jgi:hypothetical protein
MPRSRLLLLFTVVAIVVVTVGAGAWYFLAEERRMGRLVATTLSGWTGLSISVDRAARHGGQFRLRGVRVSRTDAFPLDVRVGTLDIEGGLMSLVAPAGHAFTAVASAATITVDETAGGPPLDAGAIDAFRDRLRRLLDWSGTLTLRMPDAQLARGDARAPFDLTAEKQSTGTLTVTFSAGPAGASRPLRLQAIVMPAADGAANAHVDLAGEPARLGSLWPVARPRPASLAVRSDVALRRGGEVTVTGRATVGEPSAPATIEADARWDTRALEIDVSRYVFDETSGVHLGGAARLGATRVRASGAGTVDGSRVEGRLAYELASGVFDGDVVVAPFDLESVATRLAWRAPLSVRSRELRGTLSGVNHGATSVARIAASVPGLTSRSLPDVTVDATVRGEVTVDRSGATPELRGLRSVDVTLARDGAAFATFAVASTSRGLWPLTLEGRVADASRLSRVLPIQATMGGSASIRGEIRPDRITGTLTAELARLALALEAPIALSGIRVTLPVSVGTGMAEGASAGRSEGPGSVFVERAAVSRVVADRVLSSASLADGRLLLPDLGYVHYGGHGGGWIEAAVDGRATPFRARLEGQRIDLAALVRESGIDVDVARVTGRLKYVASAEYTLAHGFAGLVRFESEEGGGRVGIDAVNRLLQSSAVQTESSGLLRHTLESLRVFDYQSLDGELRLTGGASHLDLTLRGKRRLGLFPGPIEAITIRNAPLSAVARAFTGGTSP